MENVTFLRVSESSRESGNVTCYESGKGPVDPASDKDHWKHIGDVSLHHVRQHAGICVSATETKSAIAKQKVRLSCDKAYLFLE